MAIVPCPPIQARRRPIPAAADGDAILVAAAEDVATHDRDTRLALAAWIASLRGAGFGGVRRWNEGVRPGYAIPEDTLLPHQARCLGVSGARSIYGGVVPYPFVATKVVVHGTVDADAAVPRGWVPGLGALLHDVVLPGYSAFSRRDAMHAARRLLADGPIRLKLPLGVGGRCQTRVASAAEFEPVLDALDRSALQAHGVVLERDLASCETWSIGTTQLDGFDIVYYGRQKQTPAADGEAVYGGSRLVVMRGGLRELLSSPSLPAGARDAAALAMRFDRAVQSAWPEMLLTRRNYDVARGLDASGRKLQGVLEQSWRLGGATAAELAAIEILRRQPRRSRIVAETHEHYTGFRAPDGGRVYYASGQGSSGPRLKFVTVESNADLY